MTYVWDEVHRIDWVALDFQYVSGYGANNVGVGANFTLLLHAIAADEENESAPTVEEVRF